MTIFLCLIAISALCHMLADYQGRWTLIYLFKPLTMLLIMAMLLSFADMSEPYSRLILAGLVLSTLGDIFLMLKSRQFVAGLASFLVAHIIYITAFWQALAGNQISLLPLILLPLVLGYLAYLWRYLGAYRWPVVAYFAAIGGMLFFAGALFIVEISLMASLVLVGALLFAVSDGLLGYRQFVKSRKLSQLAILVSYFSAQSLFAASAVWFYA